VQTFVSEQDSSHWSLRLRLLGGDTAPHRHASSCHAGLLFQRFLFRHSLRCSTAHEHGTLVMFDGYQDCGTRPIDVKELDVDFYVTGALKYPIFKRKTFLNSCSQGALSDVVEASLREHIRVWHKQGSPWDCWVKQYEAARASFAHYIGAAPEEIAVITSASAGINSVASALDFSQRSKVVMSEFEFPTMGQIWLARNGEAPGSTPNSNSSRHSMQTWYVRLPLVNTAGIVPLAKGRLSETNRGERRSEVSCGLATRHYSE
jgi:Aminotransferase class-V